MVPTLREALFFCNDGKLFEGKRKVLRECGKKEEKKNARARAKRDPNDDWRKDRGGFRQIPGELRYTYVYINT